MRDNKVESLTERVFESIPHDPDRLTRLDVTKGIDPSTPLDVLIDERRKVAMQTGDAFLRDGYILLCLHKQYCLSGDYRPNNADFGRFLADHDLGIGVAAANQHMIVYSRFCDFDDNILDLVRMLGVNKAYHCATVKKLDRTNVREILLLGMNCSSNDLIIKLKEWKKDQGGNNYSPAVATMQKVARDQQRERNEKVRADATTITNIGNNVDGRLIGNMLFVPRKDPLSNFNGIKHERWHELAMCEIFNMARGNVWSMDEMCARMIYGLFKDLTEKQKDLIIKRLSEEYPRIEAKFEVAERQIEEPVT